MLDADDLRGLALACARRFPSADMQRRYAGLVGMPVDRTVPGDAEAAWEVIFRAADDAGSLGVLAAALVKDAPNDETFLALARTLTAATAPERSRGKLIGMISVVAVLIGGGWALLSGGEEVSSRPAVVARAKTEAPVVVPPVAAPVEAAVAPEVAAPAAPSVTEPKRAEPRVVAAPSPAAPAPLRVGCTGGPPGEVVGYFYAGADKPGEAGQVITLSRDARVRADYPRRENHHNARSPERCVLPRGTELKLDRAPVDASKGHWWVPVVAGG